MLGRGARLGRRPKGGGVGGPSAAAQRKNFENGIFFIRLLTGFSADFFIKSHQCTLYIVLISVVEPEPPFLDPLEPEPLLLVAASAPAPASAPIQNVKNFEMSR